jgi:hypothetical protein
MRTINKKMKNAIIILLCIFFHFQNLNAQIAEGEKVAEKIANRLADSLSLNSNQRLKIQEINLSLHNQKMYQRTLSMPLDSLKRSLQLIENSRDDLYFFEMDSAQFSKYKANKKILISAQ